MCGLLQLFSRGCVHMPRLLSYRVVRRDDNDVINGMEYCSQIQIAIRHGENELTSYQK